MSDSRPKTKKLRNATPNINLPVINSASNKPFNWKTLSESNVYILKKLPEVSLKETSLNQLDRIEFDESRKKELIKQNSSSSLGKVKTNSENLKHKAAVREYSGHRPTTNQKLRVDIKCYLCNKQFTGKEIIKHEAECLERWRRLSSDEKRRAVEEQKRWLKDDSDVGLSSESDLNEADGQGQWKKFKAILRSCSKCGRNFFEHRLEKHEANCKGKQVLSKLEESDADTVDRKETLKDQNGQQENIVFVRKTKPLISRSTQLYKQQQNQATAGLMSPSRSSGESGTDSPLSSRKQRESGEEANEKPKDQPSDGENEKGSHSTGQGKANITSYFAKCPQCGRVLNKSKLLSHERYHARTSSLGQPSDDKTSERRTDHLSCNGLSLDGSSLSPVNPVDVKAERSSEPTTKAELILQLSKQFNPINPANQSNQPIQVNQTSLPIAACDQLNDRLMFDDEEWSEHLAKLKMCSKCNRTFFSDRIKKHQSICKAKKAQPV